MSKKRDHLADLSTYVSGTGVCPGRGARYAFECFTIRLVALNNFPEYVPSTTTPMPARNICGGRLWLTTWTDAFGSCKTKRRNLVLSLSWTEPGRTCPPRRKLCPVMPCFASNSLGVM